MMGECSRVRIIDVPEEGHDYLKHWYTETHVVIDLSAKKQNSILLELQVFLRGLCCLFCLLGFPSLPALVEVLSQ